MVETAPQLKSIILRFSEELALRGIHVERILLFGSHATGTMREGSDIDLIVISEDWASLNDRERFELLGIAAARILEPIQARGFTTHEINSNQLTPFWTQLLNKQAVSVF